MCVCSFHSCLRKCLRCWSWTQAKMEKCSFLVLAFEMFIVSLLSHYIPLCLHCEWLVLIMQMRQWRAAWVIITAEDGLWKSSPSHCHRDTTSWAERMASSNALSSPMAEQMHQVLPGFHRVCPGRSKWLFNMKCICSGHLKRLFSAYCFYTSRESVY